MSIILETSIGDITVDLYLKERPRCCLNFLKLCKIKYYNYHLFHTVQQNFIAQTGDPTGTGRGGDSIFGQLYGHQARLFEAETKPRIKHTKRGSLSMVNDGNNMHGSQFFITLVDDIDYLDKQNHTVFGEVAEGFDILDKLNKAIADDKGRPLKDIRIYHTVILDDPIPDPAGLKELVPASSPERNTQEELEPRIGADEVTDDEKDLNPEEIEARNKERDAKTNAQLLEMVGDIPEADIKPPDNVLFVCKLNPVTGDDDLDSIFSRFGRILGCEVIRDRKTNESLQYAFIEFEKAEDCERAYFKMDNVLIDDRRIHVDFSQSVSKYQWNRNKETAEKEEAKPQYRIKDFEKRNEGYEYVFDEPASEHKLEKKKQKKERSQSKIDKTSKKKKIRKCSPPSSSSEDEPPMKQSKKLPSSHSSDDYSSQKKLRHAKSEQKGNDDYRKGDDGYRKGDGGYHKGDDGYRKGDDGYRKGDGGYRKGDDGYRKGDDGFRKGDGGYRKGDDGFHKGDYGYHKNGDDGYHKGDYGHRKGDDSYRKGNGGYRKGDDYHKGYDSGESDDYPKSRNQHKDEDDYKGSYKRKQSHKSRH